MILPSSLIYTILVIGIMVFATLGFVGILSSNYGVTTNLQVLNKTIDIGTQINQSYQQFNTNQPVTSALGITGFFVVGIQQIWQFIQIFLSAPDTLGSMIVDFFTIIGLPPQITGGLLLIVLAGALFGFYYFFTGRIP